MVDRIERWGSRTHITRTLVRHRRLVFGVVLLALAITTQGAGAAELTATDNGSTFIGP